MSSWYILHWRPNSGSVILSNPDNTQRNAKKRESRKRKKQRQLERKKGGQRKDNDNEDPGRNDANGSGSSKVESAA